MVVTLCGFLGVTFFEGLTEVEMGIDLRYVAGSNRTQLLPPVSIRLPPAPGPGEGSKMGVGEVMNSIPLLLQGCMAVVSLSVILGYTFHRRPIGRSRKVCRPKLRGGSVPSAEVRGTVDTLSIIGVYLLLGVYAVVLRLLLMAGDVERNPGPTGKKGSNDDFLTAVFPGWSLACRL